MQRKALCHNHPAIQVKDPRTQSHSLELEGDNEEPEPLPGRDPADPHVPGDFPRLSRPITRDQTEFPDPELPHPPVVEQPVGLEE